MTTALAPRPACVRCDAPIGPYSVIGPTTAIATCGCLYDPQELEQLINDFETSMEANSKTTDDTDDVQDEQDAAVGLSLKFGDEYLEEVRAKWKTTTARYDLERDVDPGDKLTLLDERGERIGQATVERVSALSASSYAEIYSSRYDTTGELLDNLRRHYPEEPASAFTPGVQLTVIDWYGFDADADYWRRDEPRGGRQ